MVASTFAWGNRALSSGAFTIRCVWTHYWEIFTTWSSANSQWLCTGGVPTWHIRRMVHMWQVEWWQNIFHKQHILGSVGYYLNTCRSSSRMLMMLEPQRSGFLWTPGNIPKKGCQMSTSRSTKDQHFMPGMMPPSSVMTGTAWQRLNAVKRRRKCWKSADLA